MLHQVVFGSCVGTVDTDTGVTSISPTFPTSAVACDVEFMRAIRSASPCLVEMIHTEQVGARAQTVDVKVTRGGEFRCGYEVDGSLTAFQRTYPPVKFSPCNFENERSVEGGPVVGSSEEVPEGEGEVMVPLERHDESSPCPRDAGEIKAVDLRDEGLGNEELLTHTDTYLSTSGWSPTWVHGSRLRFGWRRWFQLPSDGSKPQYVRVPRVKSSSGLCSTLSFSRLPPSHFIFGSW